MMELTKTHSVILFIYFVTLLRLSEGRLYLLIKKDNLHFEVLLIFFVYIIKLRSSVPYLIRYKSQKYIGGIPTETFISQQPKSLES